MSAKGFAHCSNDKPSIGVKHISHFLLQFPYDFHMYHIPTGLTPNEENTKEVLHWLGLVAYRDACSALGLVFGDQPLSNSQKN